MSAPSFLACGRHSALPARRDVVYSCTRVPGAVRRSGVKLRPKGHFFTFKVSVSFFSGCLRRGQVGHARCRAGRPAAGTGPSSSRCGSDAACRCRPIDRRALWWCAAHSSNAAHSSPPCISRPSFLPELTSGQPRHGCHGRIGRRMARGVGAWSRAITPTSREPLVSRRMSPDAPNSHCLPSTACCRSDTHLYETGQAVSVHAERLRRPSRGP